MKRLLRSIKCVGLSWCGHSPIGNGGQKLSPLLHSDQQHRFQRSDIRQGTITRPDHASAWLECFLPKHYVLGGSESPRGEGEREGMCLRKSTTCRGLAASLAPLVWGTVARSLHLSLLWTSELPLESWLVGDKAELAVWTWLTAKSQNKTVVNILQGILTIPRV